MKGKIAPIIFILALLIAAQTVTNANACHKEAQLISTGDGDMVVEVGENCVWLVTIYLVNDQGAPMTNVKVTDNLGGELEIDSYVYISKGTVDVVTTGASEKIHLTWNVGNLAVGEPAWLIFYISTDINPGGKQEYTSPGEYFLNSGPTMKWLIDGIQGSLEMPPIMVTVLP